MDMERHPNNARVGPEHEVEPTAKACESFAMVQPLSKLHRLHRYSVMLIAIPAEGYLRSYR